MRDTDLIVFDDSDNGATNEDGSGECTAIVISERAKELQWRADLYKRLNINRRPEQFGGSQSMVGTHQDVVEFLRAENSPLLHSTAVAIAAEVKLRMEQGVGTHFLWDFIVATAMMHWEDRERREKLLGMNREYNSGDYLLIEKMDTGKAEPIKRLAKLLWLGLILEELARMGLIPPGRPILASNLHLSFKHLLVNAVVHDIRNPEFSAGLVYEGVDGLTLDFFVFPEQEMDSPNVSPVHRTAFQLEDMDLAKLMDRIYPGTSNAWLRCYSAYGHESYTLATLQSSGADYILADKNNRLRIQIGHSKRIDRRTTAMEWRDVMSLNRDGSISFSEHLEYKSELPDRGCVIQREGIRLACVTLQRPNRILLQVLSGGCEKNVNVTITTGNYGLS